MREDPAPAVDITLLVCTYNRSADLRDMLDASLAQVTDGRFTFEVLVVDNNSTDDTRDVVESCIARGHANVRYLFEATQGKSHALNAGLKAARGELFTTADDDYIFPAACVGAIVDSFRKHPEVTFVGGKVLPIWRDDVPTWLGPSMWSPVAIADYGDHVRYVDERNQLCLLGCSFRRADVVAAGGYRTGLSVSQNLIGGVEDLEILQRLWTQGHRGLYDPRIVFHHKVRASRLTKAYHRRWHTGHGRFYAALRDPDFERSSARIVDVPVHLYREAAAAAIGWVAAMLRGRRDVAFECETRLRFFVGFWNARRAEHKARRGGGVLSEAPRCCATSSVCGPADGPSPQMPSADA